MVVKKQYWGLVVSLAVFASLQIPLVGGFTDDGYIHIQYANNIITRGEYSFNPGEVSFGTTSPLWVLVHAAVGRITGGGERLMTTSRLLSWLGGIAALLLIFALARRLGLGHWTAFLCTLTFAARMTDLSVYGSRLGLDAAAKMPLSRPRTSSRARGRHRASPLANANSHMARASSSTID